MRWYTDEPEQFEREWRAVGVFLAPQADCIELEYGASCAAYLLNPFRVHSPRLTVLTFRIGKFIRKSHNVTALLYHFVLPAKYRRIILADQVDAVLRSAALIFRLATKFSFLEIGKDKDHVHFCPVCSDLKRDENCDAD